MHQLESARVPHVHAEPLLAHVLLQKVAAVPVDEVGMRPSGVALGRTFDLDDFRAHGRKAPGQERAGEKVAVVDDADPAKRRGSVGAVGVGPLGHGASVCMKRSMRSYTAMESTHRRPLCIVSTRSRGPFMARPHRGPAANRALSSRRISGSREQLRTRSAATARWCGVGEAACGPPPVLPPHNFRGR